MVRKLVLSLVAVLSVFAMAIAQNKQVSGTVVDGEGQPIAGATVIVAGTTVGTTTGASGEFVLSAPANGSLQVSFIGYQTETVAIAGKTNVAITLHEDSQAIDDVVVVAFGTMKKDAFTGAATVVKSEDIAKTQSGNVAQALAGKVAGVQMVNTSGQPGSSPTIHIRGFGSITAGKTPLYVVDGMPYEGDLANLNPSDIESMTVLKDASSNALYGARGANGVIMITTKKAKAGDAIVNVDAKIGVNSRAVQEYNFIKNPALYYETHYNALKNYAFENYQDEARAHRWAVNNMIESSSYGLGYNVYTVPTSQDLIGSNGKLNPNATLGRMINYDGEDYWLQPDDWNEEAYRTSVRQEYNVSIAGSTERSNVYASAGYLSDQGIVAHSDMERLTARLRADYKVKNWLKVGGNFSYSHFIHNSLDDEGNSGSSGNLFTLTANVAPIYPVYVRDAEGKIMHDANGFTMYDYGNGMFAGMHRPVMGNSNPLQAYALDTNRSEGNGFTGNMFADFYLCDGLTLTVNASTFLDETRFTSVTNPYYGQYASSEGIVTVEHMRSYAYNLQQLLNYSKVFAEKHSVDVMVGHEYYNSKGFDLYASSNKMFSQSNVELNGALVTGQHGSSRSEYATEGYFFRAQYDFDNKYYVNGSYRRDASTRFHPDHRWGNFWSVGAGWMMNKENWFNVDWVDMLKAKVSYGQQGNDSIGSYRYTDLYSLGISAGSISILFGSKGNEMITWETNSILNAGFDFEVLKGRIGGTVDFFNRKTTDMLFSRPTPPSAGFTSYMDNIGDMVNRGIEIDLHATPIVKGDFRWDVNLNMTHLKNKVTKLPPEKIGKDENGNVTGMVNGSYWLELGKPYYTLYMRQYAGVDATTGESLWWKDTTVEKKNAAGETMKDSEGNPIMETVREKTNKWAEGTYYECGDVDPELYGGFGTSFSWKGFDLSVAFTYQIGGQVYDSGYAALMDSPYTGNLGGNIHTDILNAWTPENATSNIPRFQLNDQYTNAESDRFLTSASYLNVQNINVGYTLPKNFTKKFLVEKLRIYVACDNVWYWSKRQGLDPRQSFSGSTSAQLYAPVRTISGGINIQF